MRAPGPPTTRGLSRRCRLRIAGLALALGLFLGVPSPAVAQTIRQPGVMDNGGLPLRWDNVEGHPYYIEGPPLFWVASLGMHVAELSERTSLTVKLPPNALLRVVQPRGALSPDDLEIMSSDGAGLRVPLSPIASSDPRSLFVFPESVRTTLVHIRSRGERRTRLRLALFISRV